MIVLAGPVILSRVEIEGESERAVPLFMILSWWRLISLLFFGGSTYVPTYLCRQTFVLFLQEISLQSKLRFAAEQRRALGVTRAIFSWRTSRFDKVWFHVIPVALVAENTWKEALLFLSTTAQYNMHDIIDSYLFWTSFNNHIDSPILMMSNENDKCQSITS